MSAEGQLLRRLQAVLADADVDVDVDGIVSSAWEDARREVGETLRRLMVRELLGRADRHLSGAGGDLPPAQGGEVVSTAPADSPTQPPGASDTVTYLFAVMKADASLPTDLPAMPGGGPIRTVEAGGLRAVVSTLERRVLADLQEPDPASLETLAAAAQTHDATLAACARQASVLPLRLGTVVADDAAVATLLEAHADALAEELDRLAGHAEWSVTVHLGDDPSEADPAPDVAGSGRAYLQGRQASLQARDRRRDADRALAEDIHAALVGRAVGAQVIGAKPVPEIVPPLLHAVYLVDDTQQPAFAAAVDEVRERHPQARVDVTGPWPAYHFANVHIGEDTNA